MRGVISSRATRSPNSTTEWIIFPSLASRIPSSSPTSMKACTSSSVTSSGSWSFSSSRSRRSATRRSGKSTGQKT